MKILPSKFILLTIVFTFISCTSSQISKKEKEELGVHSGVTLDIDEQRDTPQIDQKANYPFIENQINADLPLAREPVVGVFLGPSLYASIKYVAILEQFKQKKLSIRAVTGVGLGAIISAMYAFNFTLEEIEWTLHSFFQRVKGVKAYSEEWSIIAEANLLTKLKDKKIQESSVFLLIPAYNKKKNKVIYYTRGNLFRLLKANLELYKKNPVQQFSSPVEWDFLNNFSTKEIGIDTLVVSNVSNISLSTGNEYLMGVFGKAVTNLKKIKTEYFFIEIPAKGTQIDDYEQLPLILKTDNNYVEKIIMEIKQKREGYSNGNNSSQE